MVPETFEGWAVLHEQFRIRWESWKKIPASEQQKALNEATEALSRHACPQEGSSAFFSMLGHKSDLMFVHFRNTFEELNEVELAFRQTCLSDFLEETTSYVSIVELGVYEMTMKLTEKLKGEGLKPESDEWATKWKSEMGEQRERMKGRLYPTFPDDPYICFYPMNKKRGEKDNWYTESMERRQMMMRDHGMIGRKYAGQVIQVISGSIGLDDWEWGVDLFSKDPLVFKKLIYEMRFDEASARFAEFGPFYVGQRIRPEQLSKLFSGQIGK
jgi:chlorite dismutase